MNVIRRDTLIEDLVRDLPGSVGYLRRKRIQAVACGEPIWGTLEDAARAKGFTEPELDEIVADLFGLLAARQSSSGVRAGAAS